MQKLGRDAKSQASFKVCFKSKLLSLPMLARCRTFPQLLNKGIYKGAVFYRILVHVPYLIHILNVFLDRNLLSILQKC